MTGTVLIVCLLVALVAWAMWTMVQRSRKGSACCGEHESTIARTGASDRNPAHYPHESKLSIGGMTCDNCARKVENALNALEGTWATVRIADHVAQVRSKGEPDEQSLRRAVREAGYVVLSCEHVR